MFDGGLNFLKQAKQGLESKDIPKFAKFLSKGQAIIAELMNTLDFEKGGDIARQLDKLYDFMLFYLTEANIQKDVAKLERVIRLLQTIADAYRDIIENGKYDPAEIEAERSKKSSQAPDPTSQLDGKLPNLLVSL